MNRFKELRDDILNQRGVLEDLENHQINEVLALFDDVMGAADIMHDAISGLLMESTVILEYESSGDQQWDVSNGVREQLKEAVAQVDGRIYRLYAQDPETKDTMFLLQSDRIFSAEKVGVWLKEAGKYLHARLANPGVLDPISKGWHMLICNEDSKEFVRTPRGGEGN